MENNQETTKTKAIINNFYGALMSRDINLIASKFAPEMDWYIPGDESLAPWVGYRTKSAEVKEFFEMLLSNIESVSFELEHLVVEGDFGVATGRFISKILSTGNIYKSPFSAHFQVKDELIRYYRFMEDSNALVKALNG